MAPDDAAADGSPPEPVSPESMFSEPVTSYDEFGLFDQNIEEFGLDVIALPSVRRVTVSSHDLGVSALVWGDGPPDVVLIHGGSQNAHTWDTVALALGQPLVAIDLPGHGHSEWRSDGRYDPTSNAEMLAPVIAELAPDADLLVGMSLGGLTAIALAAAAPELVRSLVLVDITPGVDREKAKAIIDFVSGPQSFPSFDELLARTMEHHPTRSESSLRRGILHNARQLANGSWVWRYDRRDPTHGAQTAPDDGSSTDLARLWDDYSSIRAPIMLVRGGSSPVVDDADVAEARRRQPSVDVAVVDGAGHSVQGDRPVELAALIARRRA